MEQPQIRHKNDQEKIKQFLAEDEEFHPENIANDKYVSLIVVPFIEQTLGRSNETYSKLLQRELELYKKSINYSAIKAEVQEGMRLRKPPASLIKTENTIGDSALENPEDLGDRE